MCKDVGEELARKHRRAEIAHVSREHAVEGLEELDAAVRRLEPRLLRFPNLVADLVVEALPGGSLIRRKRKRHCDLTQRKPANGYG